MTPEEFICKHITEKLVADGLPEVVARGGWITTAAAHRPVVEVRCLMIAIFMRGNGHLGRQRLLSESKRKSPACSELRSEPTFKELEL